MHYDNVDILLYDKVYIWYNTILGCTYIKITLEKSMAVLHPHFAF